MKLFLCYSSKDAAVVTEIRDILESHGVPCWMAPRDVPPGKKYEKYVIKAIKESSCVIVFISSSSILSSEVEKEVRQAAKKKKPFLPVAIDGTAPEDLPEILDYHLSGPQWIFVRDGAESAVADILKPLNLNSKKHEKKAMNNDVPSDIIAKFQAKFDWLRQYARVGEPIEPGIYRTLDGGWQCNYHDWCAIVIRPGETEPHEIHGAIGQRWYREWGAFDISGKRGSLGHPISDEEIYDGDGDPNDRISHFENGDIIWTAKTDETRIVNIKDRARWYKTKHDQLLDLLRRAVEAPAPERHNAALKAVDAKCKEDQFDVVLLGKFQDGKSTTLDTLCCGREVSPQGSGTTPTSAVPVSVQALSAEENEEWGEVRFKSKRELAGELFDTFELDFVTPDKEHPLKKFSFGNEGAPRDRFCDNFEFDNQEHLEIARSALQAAWSQYNESADSKFRFSTRQRQLMEVCTLVTRFYGTKAYREMLSDVRHPVDGVGGFVWFPSDWSENATMGFDYDISFDDVRFAFVDSVVLHIRSPFLEKLGCRVTDCPGLDASAYDKEITRRALLKADGVLFVHKCDRMIGASSLGELFDFVQQTGRTTRTVLALNLWGIGRDVATNDTTDRRGRPAPCVVNASVKAIRKENFDFPIGWCHVLLAYLSALGRRWCETKKPFSEVERRWLAEKANEAIGSQTDESLWLSALKDTNSCFRVPALDAISALDMHAVEEVWEVSNFEKLLGSVSETVLREKVGSILVDNGSRKALETLIAHETELDLAEKEARKKASDSKTEFAAAEKSLESYEEAAKLLVDESYLIRSREDTVERLADELTMEVLSDDFFNRLSRGLAEVVYNLNENLTGVSQKEFSQCFNSQATPIIVDMYVSEATARLVDWKESPHGKWEKFNREITKLDKAIHELGTKYLEGSLFDGIPKPGIPSIPSSAILFDKMAKRLLDCLQPLAERLREGFWWGLWNAFKWLAGGWILKKLGLGKTKDEICKKYSGRILPEIKDTFERASMQRTLIKGAQPAFDDVFGQIEGDVKSERDKYKAALQSRWQELKEVSDADDVEKVRIAEKNRDIRVNCIEPLRKEIEVFEATVMSVVQ